MAQAQGFDMPAATRWGSEQLSDFCDAAEFGLGFVPFGTLLMPPSYNYYDQDAFDDLPSEEAQAEHDAQLREVRDKLERMFKLDAE